MQLNEKRLGFISKTAQRLAEDVWEAICAIESGPFTIAEITDEIYAQFKFHRVGKKGQEKEGCISRNTLRNIVAAVLTAVESEGQGVVTRGKGKQWQINDAS